MKKMIAYPHEDDGNWPINLRLNFAEMSGSRKGKSRCSEPTRRQPITAQNTVDTRKSSGKRDEGLES